MVVLCNMQFFFFLLRLEASNNMSDRKAVIKNADMSEDMQQDAVDVSED